MRKLGARWRSSEQQIKLWHDGPTDVLYWLLKIIKSCNQINFKLS
jgi:hypothetical protein